jgi:hypothetical protein
MPRRLVKPTVFGHTNRDGCHYAAIIHLAGWGGRQCCSKKRHGKPEDQEGTAAFHCVCSLGCTNFAMSGNK